MPELKENKIQSPPAFCLATDLDGTFLGGNKADREKLYAWLEMHRAAIQLIFVTGRDLAFIERSCSEGVMPWPDYVVGDVGTTLAVCCHNTGSLDTERHGTGRLDTGRHGTERLVPEAALETHIKALWGEGINSIREALDAAPGITPQSGNYRYRMSYHYDRQTFDPAVKTIIEEAGFDCLISDDRFLDVLPKGVSKGPSLLRLLTWLSTRHENVLVAGDTLNDLSLFEVGLQGVAVGNAEPALIAEIKNRDNVFFAKGHGAGGVTEAINALGFRKTVQSAAKLKQEIPA